jgi:hypothetical protein
MVDGGRRSSPVESASSGRRSSGSQRHRAPCGAQFGCATTVLIDATGVGRPVLQQVREGRIPANIVGITITSGRDESHHPADYRDYLVPKRLLIQTVDMLMHRGALKVAALDESENLLYELHDFRYRVDPETGYESFSARSSEHDDAVLAIAQAAWFATIPERTVIATTLTI